MQAGSKLLVNVCVRINYFMHNAPQRCAIKAIFSTMSLQQSLFVQESVIFCTISPHYVQEMPLLCTNTATECHFVPVSAYFYTIATLYVQKIVFSCTKFNIGGNSVHRIPLSCTKIAHWQKQKRGTVTDSSFSILGVNYYS